MDEQSDRRSIALGNLVVLSDEILDTIITNYLDIEDVCRLACVSSVFNVFCSEEPLWKNLCVKLHLHSCLGDSLRYHDSWRSTALNMLARSKASEPFSIQPPLRFSGFSSMYLYRRWYRSNVSLDGFSQDNGLIERRGNLAPEEFRQLYDGKLPVILTDVADSWQARHSWGIADLAARCGDAAFKVTVEDGRPVKMKMRDYASYVACQLDEEPLYVFDEDFGQLAPTLMADYSVPPHFSDDWLGAMGPQAPNYKWLVVGPARSGASWHVDPSLTNAWNTLLVGRKRWGIYPPGRVPPGVSMQVDKESGQVSYDSPTSLQWWLEVYPTLAPNERPLEVTQEEGETIVLPSGWWHAVLNLQLTVAVTHNYASSANFEAVCLDMAPGFRHRGVARAGHLAARENARETGGDAEVEMRDEDFGENVGAYQVAAMDWWVRANQESQGGGGGVQQQLSALAAEDYLRHENGQLAKAKLRLWLRCLWVERPHLHERIWKVACLTLGADTWQHRVGAICQAHSLPEPAGIERLPVGSGHNVVFLVGDFCIKLYIADASREASRNVLDIELELYASIRQHDPGLFDSVPTLLHSGFVVLEEDSAMAARFRALQWTGEGDKPALLPESDSCPEGDDVDPKIWPYIVTRRFQGVDLIDIGPQLPPAGMVEVCRFSAETFSRLHRLPVPSPDRICQLFDPEDTAEEQEASWKVLDVPAPWLPFVRQLRSQRLCVADVLDSSDILPKHLLAKLDDYLPSDPADLVGPKVSQSEWSRPCWLHTDAMDDNILLTSDGSDPARWHPSCLLDFGGVEIGDPLYDLTCLHLCVFKSKPALLKMYSEMYSLKEGWAPSDWPTDPLSRTSYRAMCYSILHHRLVLQFLFKFRPELQLAKTFEEIEERVWGPINL